MRMTQMKNLLRIFEVRKTQMKRNTIAKGLTYVELPATDGQTATFYLAAEEFLAHTEPDKECFFMWQVAPTVVVGRNQSIENEVDLDYCRRHNVDVCRRKSGGGAIYADRGNVMFSLVSPGMNVADAYTRYLNLIIPALRSLDLPAEASGRNDIIIDGRKVSGTAFYQSAGHSIVHGTMLYDTDMANMTGCLTPGADKLRTKGVKSVPSRIGLLKKHLGINITGFKHHIRGHLCDKTLSLTEADSDGVKAIEQTYRSPDFIHGANPPCDFTRRLHIADCGTVEARVSVHRRRIKAVNFTGDFFPLADLSSLQSALAGIVLSESAIRQAVLATAPERFIRHFSTDDLICLLLDEMRPTP